MSDPLKLAKQYATYNNNLYMSNTRQAQAYNSAEAAKNRDWQERLSNSAHQREVADLKAAGLNPVLSAGGQGATTGSGASASSDSANVDTSMVGAVIDMAQAQLNSATQLQTTAMQTNAQLAMNALDNDTARWKHSTPSGDSFSGQWRNAGSTIDSALGNFFGSKSAKGVRSAFGAFKKRYSNASKADIVNDLISASGLTGAVITSRTKKSNSKYRKSGDWYKRSSKPSYVQSKGVTGNGPLAVYKNTVADKYRDSKSYRAKYRSRQRAFNNLLRK